VPATIEGDGSGIAEPQSNKRTVGAHLPSNEHQSSGALRLSKALKTRQVTWPRGPRQSVPGVEREPPAREPSAGWPKPVFVSRLTSSCAYDGSNVVEVHSGLRAHGRDGRQTYQQDQGQHDGVLDGSWAIFGLKELPQFNDRSFHA